MCRRGGGARRAPARNLWVEGSRRYRQLADFFLPEPEWTARRADFFSRARLPAKAEDGGRFLARRLAVAYDRFQSRFPENAQVKVTEDGWRLSSDVLAVENDVVPFDRADVLGAGLRPGLPW